MKLNRSMDVISYQGKLEDGTAKNKRLRDSGNIFSKGVFGS